MNIVGLIVLAGYYKRVFLIKKYTIIWTTVTEGMSKVKVACLVLCLKNSIPKKTPALPPRNAKVNKVFSGILRFDFLADCLSYNMKTKPMTFINSM